MSGCALDNPGVDPPRGRLAFPIDLALSPDGRLLYVLDSNFDLSHNGGSVQSFDVEALGRALRAGITVVEEPADELCLDPAPGGCGSEPVRVWRGQALLGS
ncbi:MAG: hypothetical protein RMK74_14435, partial [Myxococcales bacterium]|nr:hypothetical protein [Myxococcales bacterium]